MTDALIARWRAKNAEVLALQRPTARKTVAMAALTRTLRQAVQVVMLALGAWLVITAQATPGVMIACTILLGRALRRWSRWWAAGRCWPKGAPRCSRLARAARSGRPPSRSAWRCRRRAAGCRPAASCSARRGSERLLLAGVSLQLEPGESLAIVGPSGAGKSTLVRLLTGVWKPTAGTVRLDQADLSQWPREDLGPWIGYVPQDVELFPGTVAENIARLGEVDLRACRAGRAARRRARHDPRRCPTATTPWSIRPARCCRPASGSASRWRARCTAIRGW